MAGLRLEHIYKVYPNGTKAVSDFTMEIKDKEFIVFVGPSGCGKSTTLRMIAGLEEISAGELYIGDDIVNDIEPKDRDIAMVFQNYALYPHMTVYENMAFGLKLRHVPSAEIHEKVLWAASVLDLTEYLDRKPKAMSGGQRQRVALGRSILRNPKVMLLDEPLSNLDAKLRTQMRSEIAKLHEKLETTFIYVTHDQVEAMTLGTRVVVMKLGKVMQIDTPKNLYDYPNNLFVAGFIGTPQMNFFNAKLTKNNSIIHIDLENSESSLDVPQSLLAKVQPQYFNSDKTVVVGVRCEGLSFDPEVVGKSKYLIDVKVSHFEELGSETLIYGDINKDGDGFTESNTRVIVKGTSSYNLKKGSIVKAAVDISKMHLFDKETEKTINPRIPVDNLVSAEVKNGVMVIDKLSYQLPEAIKIEDGNYEVLIPTSAVKLVEGHDLEIVSKECVVDTNLVGVQLSDHLLFTVVDELPENNMTSLSFDYTQIRFMKGQKVVQAEVPYYDKVDAIFMNHASAKSFVGDAYDKVVEARLKAVDDKFIPLLAAENEEYNEALSKALSIDKASIEKKNAPLIEQKKKEINELIEKTKADFNKEIQEAKARHNVLLADAIRNVEETYSKIYNDEIYAFESFLRINKDRDAFRKRSAELRVFKSNFVLEKKNEHDKQVNLEALRYESEINTLKGKFNRTIEALKRECQTFIQECNNEANPIKLLTKNHKKKISELNKQYKNECNRANIIFFFKTNDLLTLATDEITNKMIQGLGIKVFTKQYVLEIPHDAYKNSDEGLELIVLENLDYGKIKYIHCKLKDDSVERDIYLDASKVNVVGKTVKVTFDVSKIHITEKSMDIKIY